MADRNMTSVQYLPAKEAIHAEYEIATKGIEQKFSAQAKTKEMNMKAKSSSQPSGGGNSAPKGQGSAKGQGDAPKGDIPQSEMPKPPAQKENGEDNKTTEKCDLEKAPSVNIEKDRIKAIKDNACAKFDIEINTDVKGDKPKYSSHSLGHTIVNNNKNNIADASNELGVDKDLIKSIIYVEASQGGIYGYPADWVFMSDTIMPMNVSKTKWKDLAKDKNNMYNSNHNIHTGTKLLKEIQSKVKGVDPSKLDDKAIEKIGTLYNSLYKEKTTDFGARVLKVYKEKPWNQEGAPDALFYGM
ncbi:MAG: hypothetical protein GY804_04505 [Alphaproteobacteria bacterium]|nr:hypothetical protein [Alphaproteobacteria bacterium]